MTEADIVQAYLDREAKAAATRQGQDVRAICEEVGKLCDMHGDDVYSLVIEHTLMGPN